MNGGLPASAGGFQWPPPPRRPASPLGRAAWLDGDGPVGTEDTSAGRSYRERRMWTLSSNPIPMRSAIRALPP